MDLVINEERMEFMGPNKIGIIINKGEVVLRDKTSQSFTEYSKVVGDIRYSLKVAKYCGSNTRRR